MNINQLSNLENLIKSAKVAYFCMEFGLKPSLTNYSGGLGILAGDHMKSAADLGVPLVGVGLVYQQGYFRQAVLDGVQREVYDSFDPKLLMTELELPSKLQMRIEGHDINFKPWIYPVEGSSGHIVPLLFLDTYHNDDEKIKRICARLYDSGEEAKIMQRMVLGIAGTRLLDILGAKPDTYHLNEGHGAFVGFELTKQLGSVDAAKKKIVFTTHTPVPAGHDVFDYAKVYALMQGKMASIPNIRELAGNDGLNMATFALNTSRYANAVAKLHGEVAREMHKGHEIDHITNGVHSKTWISPSLDLLYEKIKKNWTSDDLAEIAEKVDPGDLFEAHQIAKQSAIGYINDYNSTGVKLSPDLFTLIFARRFATYKRADLIFSDLDELLEIGQGRLQIAFAGKAHPADDPGKEIIKNIHNHAKSLKGKINVAFIPNYDMHCGRIYTSGADAWLNTPSVKKEASGTSGMKAALNGVPTVSVIDGWVYEVPDNRGMWAIGERPTQFSLVEPDNVADAQSLYSVLGTQVLPAYESRTLFFEKMKGAIANAAYFNTNRMVREYATKAYGLQGFEQPIRVK